VRGLGVGWGKAQELRAVLTRVGAAGKETVAIVEIEGRYLHAYARAPLRADAAVLWETFKAIVFHGVRSK